MSNLPLPGPIALRTLALAIESIGVQEEGGNNIGPQVSKYIRAGEGEREAWCYHFLNYLFCKAWLNEQGNASATDKQVDDLYVMGKSLSPHVPTFSAWTPDAKEWAKKNSVWIPAVEGLAGAAMPGDWVCFYFPNLDGGRIGHIEVMREYGEDGHILTIGGNTKKEAGLSRESSNGRDGVWPKDRDINDIHVRGGFVRITV
jgi:hypothetical protein